jgi:hypothetical protein
MTWAMQHRRLWLRCGKWRKDATSFLRDEVEKIGHLSQMKYRALSALIVGISALLATAPVAANQKRVPEGTQAQRRADLDKGSHPIEVMPTEEEEENPETFAQMFRDEEVKAKAQRVLFRKIRGKDSSLLHSWLGVEKCDLEKAWGTPSSQYVKQGISYSTYVYGYDLVPAVWIEEYKAMAELKNERYSCNITFKVHNGIISDYRFEGNYCSAIENGGLARGPD